MKHRKKPWKGEEKKATDVTKKRERNKPRFTPTMHTQTSSCLVFVVPEKGNGGGVMYKIKDQQPPYALSWRSHDCSAFVCFLPSLCFLLFPREGPHPKRIPIHTISTNSFTRLTVHAAPAAGSIAASAPASASGRDSASSAAAGPSASGALCQACCSGPCGRPPPSNTPGAPCPCP